MNIFSQIYRVSREAEQNICGIMMKPKNINLLITLQKIDLLEENYRRLEAKGERIGVATSKM